MTVHRIDHVGIIVKDLAAAKAFFLDLGLEMMGEGEVEGEWAGRIIGLQNVKSEVIMLRTPGGEMKIEVSQFHSPIDENGIQPSFANTLGIRHITFVVDDVEAIVAKLTKNGAELVGEIQNYENEYKVCYIRGPEGIILELAEELES
ncbi:MAG TPA: VOC family protein [Anaerolineaceae bacterium]|nr:VOC family protein [Anaerolineaceae bacterium]